MILSSMTAFGQLDQVALGPLRVDGCHRAASLDRQQPAQSSLTPIKLNVRTLPTFNFQKNSVFTAEMHQPTTGK
jgi:hypothetical protein